MSITAADVKRMALDCGFELAGIAAALPHSDCDRFEMWRRDGFAAGMSYLTDRRGGLRSDPRNLLPSAQSILCVGKLYNTDAPHTPDLIDPARGWISRYAWGADYHDVMRESLERLLATVRAAVPEPFDAKICIDTAPLLERSYAKAAGLGWIGKNTCLINEGQGSWFFLGEILLSIQLAPDSPPPDRCGSCTRCIDACPTAAIVPGQEGSWRLDARRCISYLTIEHRGEIPEELQNEMGAHIFGCDICQDVCPWNRSAPLTSDPAFAPAHASPSLAELASITEEQFRGQFRSSPVRRTKHSGLLRNVAIAQENAEMKNNP